MAYLLDLRKKTLALQERGIRVIDEHTGEHVASLLPDRRGLFDDAVATWEGHRTLMIRDRR